MDKIISIKELKQYNPNWQAQQARRNTLVQTLNDALKAASEDSLTQITFIVDEIDYYYIIHVLEDAGYNVVCTAVNGSHNRLHIWWN